MIKRQRTPNRENREIRQGQVYWVDLGPAHGSSAPALRRPVVVIQADAFNASGLATTIVASLTTTLRLATMPGNVFVSRTQSGLPKDCVINMTQLTTLDKSTLREYSGTLPQTLLEELRAGLRLLFRL